MHLAEELRLPLVTLIDTPGAALSQEAEEGGLAGEIARCLHDLVMLEGARPWRCCSGQGTGGGALALVPADRVLARGQRLARRRCRRRARRRSCTATPTTPARWRRPGRAGHRPAGGPGSSTGSWPSGPDAADEPAEFCLRLGHDPSASRRACVALGPADASLPGTTAGPLLTTPTQASGIRLFPRIQERFVEWGSGAALTAKYS